MMQSILRDERVVIGADFNGHVGEGIRGDEEMIARFGIQDIPVEVLKCLREVALEFLTQTFNKF